MGIRSQETAGVDSFIARIRKSFLPDWVSAAIKGEKEKPKPIAYRRESLSLETCFEYGDIWQEHKEPVDVHICSICQAICEVRKIRSRYEMEGRIVYEPGGFSNEHRCPFTDQEWHEILAYLHEQRDGENDETRKAEIEIKISNIYARYRKEIDYYNNNDAKQMLKNIRRTL